MKGKRLEVWLDVDFLPNMARIGFLSNDRGNVRFNYDADWLKHPSSFNIDPSLSLDGHVFHPDPQIGNFGIFMDSSPDRWGQTLMKRREALEAKDQGRKPKTLYAWDFLIGVQDLTRQGALRFKHEDGQVFLSDSALPAPPVTSLSELASVAKEVTAKHIDDLDKLKQWLRVLVAPGASLGGARPKANFTESDGSLWIAKFPAHDDDIDVGGWEGVTHDLAKMAGVDVPEAKLVKFNSKYHTFCVERFDRFKNKRLFYSSAMTLLNKSESEGCSYLDMALFIFSNGVKGLINSDLEQLFRRVAFNVAVGNRDDHLRNHGFILTKDGWRLSPAFDVNPNINKATHVLNIDEVDNRPSMVSVLESCEYYGLASPQAENIIDEIVGVVDQWKTVAKRRGLSNAEIAEMESAFLSYDESDPNRDMV